LFDIVQPFSPGNQPEQGISGLGCPDPLQLSTWLGLIQHKLISLIARPIVSEREDIPTANCAISVSDWIPSNLIELQVNAGCPRENASVIRRQTALAGTRVIGLRYVTVAVRMLPGG
jgi:hypothetical protein